MKSASKKILVTGGAGFLGAHLCRALLTQGHEVRCVDNLFTGSLSRVEDFFAFKTFSFLQHDITHPLEASVDQIFNLACPASPVQYQKDPVHTIKTNVLGTLNLLDLARRTSSQIFQASTSEIYGDPQVHPQKEDYYGYVNPLGRRACYDEGKRVAETLFMEYHRLYGVPIRIARIFNTYGPHMHLHDGRVISNFIVQALKNAPLTLYGDGTQTRAFCYVEDLIAGILLLMEHPAGVMPVNLGNPEEVTIQALAELILDLTGSSSPIVHHPLPEDDPHLRCPDISYAKKLLGWTPTTTLKVGLLKTIEYFEKSLSLAEVSATLS